MAKCPKCGSERFEYKLRFAGADVSSTYYRKMRRNTSSWVIPAGQKNVKVNRRNVAVGFCPDCGYVDNKGGQNVPNGVVYASVFIVVMTVLLISMVIGLSSSSPKDNYIWAHEVTPLDQFEYMIDGNEIYLNEYKGKNKRVYIGSQYIIDGQNMAVVEIDRAFKTPMDSIIIPDELANIISNPFYSDNVTSLYVPKSFQLEIWNYPSKLKYLYYGGSKEELEEKYGDTTKLASERIYYNASIQDIIMQDIEAHSTPKPTKAQE